jgi:hypothetical protein
VKTILTPLTLAVALLGGLVPAARAGLILQPAAASDPGKPNFAPG